MRNERSSFWDITKNAYLTASLFCNIIDWIYCVAFDSFPFLSHKNDKVTKRKVETDWKHTFMDTHENKEMNPYMYINTNKCLLT